MLVLLRQDIILAFTGPLVLWFDKSHGNSCCLGTRECKVNDLGHFKDEMVCHTHIKIMSIIISFESTITPVIDVLYTAG